MSYSNIAALAIIFATTGLASGQDNQDSDTASTSPCASRDEYRQFDFWLGSWTVRLADGNEAGRNIIHTEQGGCALIER